LREDFAWSDKRSPDEQSDIGDFLHLHPRMSRSLSSGARSRDPLAHAGYLLSLTA